MLEQTELVSINLFRWLEQNLQLLLLVQNMKQQMFLTGSSTAILPEFYKDGAKLNVVEDKTGVKMGKVEFMHPVVTTILMDSRRNHLRLKSR